MTTLVQIAPGVVFAAEVINPKWGQSFQVEAPPPGRQGSSRNADYAHDSHDRDVTSGEQDRGEQIALL
ncbi:hypothetical protein [Candidatus Burkholderia verschuerenii]|uniref:hypothetical protein n=1 Tax=Candidatus Burkholderia verschuerenii TaxID=242163 RepID=UPI000A7532DB|nr:hypothetical protein [Candidatus Burkholderia verschuerenii]